MAFTEDIITRIKGEDKLSPVVNDAAKKSAAALKELGGNLTQVGGTLTGMFTVPIAGAFLALNKHGQDATKTVSDLKGKLDEAIAAGDPEKIKAASDAWNAIPASTRAAADAFGKIQDALAPVNQALSDAQTKILVALIPVIERLTPILVDLANKITDAVNWFVKLPAPVQDVVFGIVGFMAVLGPAIVMVGQMTTALGSFQAIMAAGGLATSLPNITVLVKGLTTSLAGLAAPVALFAAGILIADQIAKIAFGGWPQMINEATKSARELLVVLARVYDLLHFGLTDAAKETYDLLYGGGRAAGGPVSAGRAYLVGEQGPEILKMGSSGGTIIPAGQTANILGNAASGITMVNNFYGSPEQNAAAVERKVREMKRNGTI